MFDSADQAQTVLDGVIRHYNATIERIDKGGPAWRPMFIDENGNADLDRTSVWVRGFWQAMMLAPEAWSGLAEDERTEIRVEPFATFIELDAIDDAPMPDNIDENRRTSADLIPRVIPALRKLARMRAAHPPARASAVYKTGRNEACPCGSGNKYKRCCGLNRTCGPHRMLTQRATVRVIKQD